ncbi:slipin family protein [Bradyrhizobium sp. INPA01-394B]|uniref:Slipin family protein n=2 Tax=Bradyrhizobium campsiandrae TaxID=1729892 RepID=A0ABR7UIH7_9BRAD|nr:slipin family protein [Bradyrhizobium campsiandrae]MBC9983740.1 slipin family protein [Bradyrhizobium campsiandrae]
MDLVAAHPFSTIIAVAAFAYVLGSIRVANQYERSVVFRLGRFNRTAGPGLYLVWQIMEWQTKLDLRTITANVEQQEGITRDNVPIKVDAVVWYRIVDPERAVMEVKAVSNAVVQVSLTTLRAVLGQHTLDEILKAQDTIADVMQRAIDATTEPWGVKVELVQMKSVEIPPSMQRALAQEAEALREKRARLIKAEAELDAAEQLRQAAEVIMQNPAGLELRRMQMITEVGAEQNTMTLVMMPSEFVSMARGIADAAKTMAAKE